ncbi:MAG: ABC transporter substrate-binding protein [Acidimicrobiia bacterium]
MRRWISFALVGVLALAACGGGDDDDDTGGGGGDGNGETPETPDLPECPLDALETADQPVEITMWHAMTRASEEALIALTDRYNAEQDAVEVTLSASPSYDDNSTRYRSGLETGELPDLVQIEETGLQYMVDSASVLPAASCIAADNYDTSDFIERVISYYTVNDVLWPMPFNVSNPILYYNRAAFVRAGLDPEAPPRTLEEVRAAAQTIVDTGANPYGIVMAGTPWFLEQWFGKAGELYVDNENGRTERATAVEFDNPTGVELFTWIDDMVDDGLMLMTPDGAIDHYLAVGNEQAAMTFDTSAALGTIAQVLGEGQFAAVDLGFGPMVGPDSPDGGVLVGGAGLYVVNQSAPEKQAAAYEFAKWLNEPQQQAEWAAATGYVPTRQSAATMSPLAERWTEEPGYRIAYDQLLEGAANAATAGPVIGPYGQAGEGVRGAVIDALQAMLTEGVSPADALAQAAEEANAALEDYNSRF